MSRFLLLFFAVANLSSQTKVDFARSLMNERDYFRAISAYKELTFFSANTDSTIFYLSQIGKAYRFSHKYDLSVEIYAEILNTYRLSQSISNAIYVNLGLNYLGMEIPGQALPYLHEARSADTSGLALFYLGLVKCETANWEDARAYYDSASRTTSLAAIRKLSTEFSLKLMKAGDIPHRSSLLAAALSTAVPGLGQLYSTHYFDAAQAFGFVAAFSFVSYATYQNDKKNNSNYVLTGIAVSLTSLFHIANIIGAERTAAYFNQRQKNLFL
ncbi:MAG TPA: hypothetical protein VJ044_01285, partial [Candidatus Hodarchaeales archaeon]|nr:hypothetical protein [Candidatus Hodarchaeales archaeon]